MCGIVERFVCYEVREGDDITKTYGMFLSPLIMILFLSFRFECLDTKCNRKGCESCSRLVGTQSSSTSSFTSAASH